MASQTGSAARSIYETDLLTIRRQLPDQINLESKVTLSRLAALGFALLVGGGICVVFGGISYFGMQDLLVNGGVGWKGGAIATFALIGFAIAAFAVREALWECLPKSFTFTRSSDACVLQSYGLLKWTFPKSEVEFIGVRIGKLPGGNKGPEGFYSRLFVHKRRGIRRLRFCAPSIRAGSHHAAFKEAVAVGEQIATELAVPLKYFNKEWIEFTAIP
jgi:hypothetical protein